MLCQHFKRRDDGTGICLFHSAVMPEDLSVMRVLYQHPSWGYRDAVNVWGVTPAEDKFAVANAGIDAMEKFFRSIVLPMTLAEFKIDDSRFEEMAVKAVEVGHLDGAHVPLNEKDVVEILKMCM